MNDSRTPNSLVRREYSEEISLEKLLKILFTRWKSITVGALGAPLLAFIWTLSTPKEYEARVLFEIGTIAYSADSAMITIEPTSVLMARLNSDGFVRSLPKDREHVYFSITAEAVPEASSVVLLKVRAHSQAAAKELAERSLDSIVEEHRKAQELARDFIRAELTQTKADLETTMNSLAGLNTHLTSLPQIGEDPMGAFFLPKSTINSFINKHC
jgi:uncharacterized protein involved in exopolysaccharide biosynthesis